MEIQARAHLSEVRGLTDAPDHITRSKHPCTQDEKVDAISV